ncbi:hypothetical protein Bca52824_068260 [Brassica carinata]|uniref:Uncharacterized protein n=1 Tax=Brassica carinata TaxID=52824 RepID=A0A8X7U1R1_BRACI|nr:hypothetical protein Bca52824_068260 [Brassica carinata]
MSDDAFDGGPPERKAVDAGYGIRRNEGTVRWLRRRLRGGDGRSAVCGRCRSECRCFHVFSDQPLGVLSVTLFEFVWFGPAV